MGSAFAADGRSLVVWSGDLRVRIYDARSGKRLRDYPLPNELRIGQPIAPNGPSPTFYGAALSTDGRLLAVGNRWHSLPKAKYFLVLKDLATGRDVQRLDNLPADVNRLAFSPDGRVLAWSGTKDGSIHLLETASGGERRRLAGHAGGAILWLAFSTDGTRLISGGRDTTALIWDMRSPLSNHSASVADMETLWSDLAGADAGRAYRAIRKLAAAPAVTVPLLRKRLRPAPATKAERLSRLLSDLDNAEFTIRRNAAAELQKLGEQALPAYRMALDDKPTLEMRRRLEDLQTKAQAAWWDLSGERLRSLRAIEALEMAGTKEARELLHWLASGAEGARLTEEAKAAGIRTARMSRN